MTTSGPRYHIPFPKNFLSLNARPSKASDATTSPDSIEASHSFLSNRPAVPRHFSISSVSSTGSIPDSPPSQAADASVFKQAIPAFLALNTKFVGPPPTAKDGSEPQSPFLSNRR
ncbi:hypothetical protein EJ04DRAFT_521736 [Polyplosphaeria fusca]|uniref:Uncharacterized protein n=1 Tax=Polyplosphaeria fusca TaxID=682080 RepID=A0A9P4QZY4_9PLEO|nr:hypothetical protein EJ04DRAFT_521736 [Polyplosphaeria fusca]